MVTTWKELCQPVLISPSIESCQHMIFGGREWTTARTCSCRRKPISNRKVEGRYANLGHLWNPPYPERVLGACIG